MRAKSMPAVSEKPGGAEFSPVIIEVPRACVSAAFGTLTEYGHHFAQASSAIATATNSAKAASSRRRSAGALIGGVVTSSPRQVWWRRTGRN